MCQKQNMHLVGIEKIELKCILSRSPPALFFPFIFLKKRQKTFCFELTIKNTSQFTPFRKKITSRVLQEFLSCNLRNLNSVGGNYKNAYVPTFPDFPGDS